MNGSELGKWDGPRERLEQGAEKGTKAIPDETASRGLWEQLLSPLALQRMMLAGGILLVLGFAVWLWSVGVFDQPLPLAIAVGLVNGAVIGAGAWLLARTRFRLAGRALTLLGSLALPLNLWLYDAQGLITLTAGGHLWIPALACCGIYAFNARVLRDPLFVYALVGGIVMTGMLFLADNTVGRFWQLLPQTTLLLVVGWLSWFAKLLFAPGEGPFARDRFGKAFRIAGAAVLTGGFALLAGGQLPGFVEQVVGERVLPWRPAIGTSQLQQVWALVLVSGSSLLMGLSASLSQRRNAQLQATGGLALWAALCLLDVFSVTPTMSHLVTLAAGAMLAGNLLALRKLVSAGATDGNGLKCVDKAVPRVSETGFVASLILGAALVLMFVTKFADPSGWHLAGHVELLIQLLAVSAACWTTAQRNQRLAGGHPLGEPLLNGLIRGSAGGLAVLGLVTAMHWAEATSVLPVVLAGLAVPVVVLAVGEWRGVRGGHPVADTVSGSIATLLLVLAAGSGFGLTGFSGWGSWAIALGLLAAVQWLGARQSGWPAEVFAALITGCAALTAALIVPFPLKLFWTWLGWEQTAIFLGLTTLAGGLGFVSARWAAGRSPEVREDGRLLPALRAIFMTGAMGGCLWSLTQVAAGAAAPGLLVLQGVSAVGLASVALADRGRGFKLVYRALGLAVLLTALVLVGNLLDTPWYNRAELCALLAGVALLAFGHVAWSREGEHEDDLATGGLVLGSLLLAVPLAIGIVGYRLNVDGAAGWRLFHEVGGMAAGLALLGTGLACRIRATTLAGGGLLAVQVAALAVLFRWPQQLQNVSVVMMAGGGLFFAIAIVLSLYRDRLMALPAQVREGQGVFRVLKWR